MTAEELKDKLQRLHEKSEMDYFMDWPFVYDEDENGNIYIDPNGTFYFADKVKNWFVSPLNLKNVVNLRFKKFYEDPWEVEDDEEPDESVIYIYFENGDCLTLTNHRETYDLDIAVYMQVEGSHEEEFANLQSSCETRKMQFYKRNN